jgi:hypothetical protein
MGWQAVLSRAPWLFDDRNGSVQHSRTSYGGRGVTRNPGEAGPVFFSFLWARVHTGSCWQ